MYTGKCREQVPVWCVRSKDAQTERAVCGALTAQQSNTICANALDSTALTASVWWKKHEHEHVTVVYVTVSTFF